MTDTQTISGKVYSHTVIRVPGKAHAAAAPFVLLLVELDNGRRVLGYFSGPEPPPIDAVVVGKVDTSTPVFSLLQGQL
ncbi:MAG: OB-fold domain-containing protein [Rhizobiales bacterium]|nr:OB-fold domain-containing protein [Hyphomicrobiales bacterium]